MVKGSKLLAALLLMLVAGGHDSVAAKITSPPYPANKLAVDGGRPSQAPAAAPAQVPFASGSGSGPPAPKADEEATVEVVPPDNSGYKVTPSQGKGKWSDVKVFGGFQASAGEESDGDEDEHDEDEVMQKSLGVVLPGPLDPLGARLAKVKNLTVCPACPCQMQLPWASPVMGSRLVGPVAQSGFYAPEGRPPKDGGPGRNRRSVGSSEDYWSNMGSGMSSATQGNMGYEAMRKYKEGIWAMGLPLHFGQINTGSATGDGRAFGLNADFNFPKDLNAFKYTPLGTRFDLNQWTRDGFPVYGQNLYTVALPVEAFEFTASGEGQKVVLKGGYYTFDAMTKQEGNLMIKNIETGLRYLVKRFFVDNKVASSFQAVFPWKDVNMKYTPAFSQLLGGQVNIIQGSPNTFSVPTNQPNQALQGQPQPIPLPPVQLPPIQLPLPPVQVPSPFPYPFPFPYPLPPGVVPLPPGVVPSPVPIPNPQVPAGMTLLTPGNSPLQVPAPVPISQLPGIFSQGN